MSSSSSSIESSDDESVQKAKAKATRVREKPTKTTSWVWLLLDGPFKSGDRTYYKCKLSQYDSLCTANHKEDLTRVSDNTSNFRRHFNTQHHSVFLAMDNAVKAGEDPRRTLATILSTRRLKTPATTIDQLLWGRSTIQSKTNHFLSGKKRKEIALLLWLTHSAIPPNSMVNDFWHTFCEESGIAISEIGTIWKLLGVLCCCCSG